uniref:condensation domain-containing protein n=1 Tax=Sphingomonas sp. TaxID=28214 RepID=UPI002DD64A40
MSETSGLARPGADTAEGAPTARIWTASHPQTRLWFEAHLQPDAPSRNIHAAFSFPAGIAEPALRTALAQLIARHEALRTNLRTTSRGLVQVVHPERMPTLFVMDCRNDSEAAADRRVRDVIAAETRLRLDLATDPLFRVALVRLPRKSAILVTLHHAIGDLWSIRVLEKELRLLHRAAAAGVAAPLPALAVSYGALSERAAEPGLEGRDLPYWRDRLAHADFRPVVQALEGPLRPPSPASRGGRVFSVIEAGPAGAIADFAAQRGVSLFSLLLAAVFATLHRFSLRNDIVIGVPHANRDDPETHGIIGLFVNMLPIRVRPVPGMTFESLVEATARALREGIAHGRVPFELIVRAVNPPRDANSTPIFQVTCQINGDASRPIGTLEAIRRGTITRGTYQYDLAFDFGVATDGLFVQLEFVAADLAEIAGQSIVDALSALLAAAVRSPDVPLERLALGPPAKIEARPAGEPGTLAGLLDGLDADAGRVVLETQDLRITAGELAARARELAGKLTELGVGPGGLVALVGGRTPEFVAGLVATIRTGAAFLPLDAAWPEDYRRSILDDARPQAIMGAATGQNEGLAVTAGYGQAAPAGPLAYVIYTSGSTGRPKGVAVSQASAAWQVGWYIEALGLTARDRVAFSAAPAFDTMVPQVLGALAAGARLVGLGLQFDLGSFVRTCWRAPPTVLDVTPSLMATLLELGYDPATARTIVLGGEPCPAELARRCLASGAELWNMYGPTEATVTAIAGRLQSVPPAGPVPIGRAIDGVRLSIVDAAGRPVPAGVPGELVIGGAGVGLGYWRLPDLTEAAFRPDPEAPGA